MAHFSLPEANAWLESTKLSLSTLNETLATQTDALVLSRLASVFDTSTWVSSASTPALVRTICAMYYVAATYDRTYSDNSDDTTSNYAAILRGLADANIAGLLGGSIILEEDPTANDALSQPAFFPNDASSANPPSTDFPSDGGPAFMMGTVF